MVKSPRSSVVPKSMQATYDAVVALTDAFCRDHLNDEYRDLARAMTAALCRKRPSPLTLGAAAHLGLWHHPCAGPAQLPVGPGEPATYDHGRGRRRVRRRPEHGKCQGARHLGYAADEPHGSNLDAAAFVDQNPLVWMAEVNGLLVDLRDMPREVQEAAYEKGLIPYIPADQG